MYCDRFGDIRIQEQVSMEAETEFVPTIRPLHSRAVLFNTFDTIQEL